MHKFLLWAWKSPLEEMALKLRQKGWKGAYEVRGRRKAFLTEGTARV